MRDEPNDETVRVVDFGEARRASSRARTAAMSRRRRRLVRAVVDDLKALAREAENVTVVAPAVISVIKRVTAEALETPDPRLTAQVAGCLSIIEHAVKALREEHGLPDFGPRGR